MTLDQLAPGTSGTITAVTGGARRGRLPELGFVPGTRVTVVKAAPVGDPVELLLRGYCLCVRKAALRDIEIAPEAEQCG